MSEREARPTDFWGVRDWVAGLSTVRTAGLAALTVLVLAAAVIQVFFPDTRAATVVGIFNANFVEAALRAAVPIVLAAIGGIFAEKTGVINIGLEGLLIISAFTSVAVTDLVAGGGTASQGTVWIGFLSGVLASTLVAFLFAVIVIEFKADQIIAGLAVWLVGLGLGPFLSIVIWGSVNSAGVATIEDLTIPVLDQIPFFGPVLFDTSPTVLIMLLTVAGAWYVFNYTTFGRWIEASGENPSALDTAGVDVHRVRYIGVTLSGVLSGIGGAGLALGRIGKFIGSGATMVDGRGWIAITAYLFGNYNPLGTFGAGFLFAGLQAVQIRLQQIPFIQVPTSLIRLVPYVTVIIVLAFVGYTRIPSAAGEHYESGEE
ncbi:MAG: ABC transporter permease [Haloarculaceae archaeon]